MKKLFLLTAAIATTFLFTQCKKSEILTEPVIQTTKANNTDILNGTQWEVISVVSIVDSVNLTWSTKYPKFSFVNENLEMKLGRDICVKKYSCVDVKFVTEYSTSCQISNPNHNTLANLFSGEFKIFFSTVNPNEIYFKSHDEKVFTLRRINALSINSVQ